MSLSEGVGWGAVGDVLVGEVVGVGGSPFENVRRVGDSCCVCVAVGGECTGVVGSLVGSGRL